MRVTAVFGCALALASAVPAAAAAAGGSVSVLYAGSLTAVMPALSAAFSQKTGYSVAGAPGGSTGLAQEIAAGQQAPDVFISASPSADQILMNNPSHGMISWYVPFASSPLVIGYNPHSRFAAALKKGPWYQALETPGLLLGRTDPQLDPKGALTVKLVQAAAVYYHQPDLVARILGPIENPGQVFPEETLVGRLQAGMLDAGFFYQIEAVAAKIPYVTLPAPLQFSAEYTVAMPAGGPDGAGAVAFIEFLLGPNGRSILSKAGFTLMKPTAVVNMPAPLQRLLGA